MVPIEVCRIWPYFGNDLGIGIGRTIFGLRLGEVYGVAWLSIMVIFEVAAFD